MVTDIREKDKNKAKNDKTEHKNGKSFLHSFYFFTNIPETEVLAGFADESNLFPLCKQTEDLDLLHEEFGTEMMKRVRVMEKPFALQKESLVFQLSQQSHFAGMYSKRTNDERRREILFINIKKLGSNKLKLKRTNHALSYSSTMSYLIKDCDYYEKKMARVAEVKRVVNTGNGVAKPLWTNANWINHANQFVPRSVQLNAGLKLMSVSPKVNSVGPKVNAVNSKEHLLKNIVDRDSLKVPRHHNMYSFDMKTPSPAKGFACLIAKATSDESRLWHRRLGHINFKNLNKLVKGNLGCQSLPFQEMEVAKRINRTLIEAARIYAADSLFPTTLWAEAFSTASYIFIGEHGKFDENLIRFLVGYSLKQRPIGTPTSIASKEKDEEVELIVVPSTVRIPEEKDESRTSSTNSKKEDSSTDSLEDNPKIQAFRRELDAVALKHLGTVPKNNTTSTSSVNTGSQIVNTGIFDEASYDEEGVITDFNSLPIEIKVSPTPTLRIHSIHPKIYLSGMKVIGTKWVYRIKEMKGWIVMNKARLVWPKEYTQKKISMSSMGELHFLRSTMSSRTREDLHILNISNSKDFSSQCCQEDLQVSQGNNLGIMES
ncbi:ribonuclease H-like domain-containing protein [Tanacetum coccineum]